MGIKEYFKKEIYKQYILCSIPFIAMIAVFILQMITFIEEGQDEVVLELALLFYGIFLVLGIVLIITYVSSYTKYKKMLSSFSKEDLERINEEAKTVYNMGKLLITNDVVIFFGFFRKEVIPTKIIEEVEKIEGTIDGRSAAIDYKYITLKCKNGKQVRIFPPKNYNSIECEFCKRIIKYIIDNKRLNKETYISINSLKEASVFKNYKELRLSNYMEFIVAIPYLLICLIVNKVINNAITNSSDFVLNAFYSFCIKDLFVFTELAIYTIIFVIINVYYKFYNKKILKGRTLTKMFKILIFVMLVISNMLNMDISNDPYKNEARSDCVTYLKNECKTYIGKVSYYKGTDFNGINWAERYDGKVISLYANNEVLFSTEERIDENKIYQIEYLPRTHLIVEIKETT